MTAQQSVAWSGWRIRTPQPPPVCLCPLPALMLQNDFFRGGGAAIPDAESTVPVINALRRRRFDVVLVATLEHSLNHSCFASNSPVRVDDEMSSNLTFLVYVHVYVLGWGSMAP